MPVFPQEFDSKGANGQGIQGAVNEPLAGRVSAESITQGVEQGDQPPVGPFLDKPQVFREEIEYYVESGKRNT